MERLTEKTVDCFEYALKDHKAVPGEFGTYDAFFDYSMAVKRLGHYEDSGLEPEEIADFMKRWEQAVEIGGMLKKYGIDHIWDIIQAEQDGQLVVLPCKVGDRVWVTRAYGKPFDAPREGHVRKFVVHDDELVFLEALIWMDLGEGKNEYGYRTESFGKIVHLTREEAEEALALKGGDGL